jgi:ribosomal protein L32
MQALSGRAFESVRHLIDDEKWLDSVDNGEQLVELLAKPEYHGKEELESLYHAMHKLFYSELRRSYDDLPSFRGRFEQAVRKVEKHHVKLPQEALGFLFRRQAKVSGESLERLFTLTNGDLKLGAMAEGLRLKMKLMDGDESSTHKQRHLWVAETIDEVGDEATVQHDDEIDAIEQALADLDGDQSHQSVTKDAREILHDIDQAEDHHKSTTMSYKQVQQQKRKVKNARGFRPKVSSSAGSGMRRDLQQLKAVTKCKNCGEMGHWHRECPRKNQSQSSSNSTNATADQPSSHSWWSLVQTAESADVQSMVGSSQHVSADGHHSSVE